MKDKKNYMLTDFTSERWRGIDMNLVYKEIDRLNELTKKHSSRFGQVGHPEGGYDTNFKNVTHVIDNFTVVDDKVYGDVEFLNIEKGLAAKEMFDTDNYRFGLRAVGTTDGNSILIKQIFTWDIIPKTDEDNY